MSEIQDSAAIIAADMRQLADDIEAGRAIVGQSVWRSYADRVEAVGTGNVAKLREACAKAAESAAEIMERVRHKDGLAFNTANYIAGVARTALAAPPRNCDVDTAEEQSVRMAEFCREQYKKTDGVRLCSGCRFFELAGTECQFAWAQMPYEEGGANG